jgi:hypothetical protein
LVLPQLLLPLLPLLLIFVFVKTLCCASCLCLKAAVTLILRAEIVPAHQRNLVYAFDRCLEGGCMMCRITVVHGSAVLLSASELSMAASGRHTAPEAESLWYVHEAGGLAACAAPLVGLLAQKVFGFSGAGTGAPADTPSLLAVASLLLLIPKDGNECMVHRAWLFC